MRRQLPRPPSKLGFTTRNSAELNPQVLALLREHVNSYEKLEAVVAVHERGSIAVIELANLIRGTLSDTQRTVRDLCRTGLLTKDAAADAMEVRAAHRAAVEALVRAYREDALAIGSTLSRHMVERIRRDGFASRCARRRELRRRLR
jgi:hypothetical protein